MAKDTDNILGAGYTEMVRLFHYDFYDRSYEMDYIGPIYRSHHKY